MKVATFTNNDEYCAEEMRALACIILPNGEYWGVRFNGATEEIARTKAIATWRHEQEKWKALEPLIIAPRIDAFNSAPMKPDPWRDIVNADEKEVNAIAKQHHLAGLVWMIHKDTREKKRVKLTEITMYEKQGFKRGGPRSK